MSVREEDRQKNSCPSRGLGIAAAAIGVGVGAALYYFFNKRQENPNSEGSTSDWSCERPQPFLLSGSDDSYSTISEHDTSDTCMNTSDANTSSFANSDESSVSELTSEEATSELSDSDSESDFDSDSDGGSDSDIVFNVNLSNVTSETGYRSHQHMSSGLTSDSEFMEWDITTSSLGVPEERGRARSPTLEILSRIGSFVSSRRRKTEDEQMTILRQEAFRERSWTLEECSICFDVMLRNQEVTQLPCAHNFHTECIMPWLQEKQTCPNCRKVAE